MRDAPAALLGAFLLVITPGAGSRISARVEQGALTVAAAVSLTDALGAVEQAYVAAGGRAPRFSFAASNVLARQIVNGAPIDVFISADAAQMTVVEKARAIDPRTRIDLLGNRLAIVTPRGRAGSVVDARSLVQPRLRRIAIGDPAGVPAGAYAREYLQREALWDRVQSRLIPVASVRAAVAAAANASVDAAIVYETDVASSKDVDLAFVVSGPSAPRIVYPAAVVAASRERAAADEFLSFLRGPEATAIFARFKFVPLAARSSVVRSSVRPWLGGLPGWMWKGW
jgi:molybdate transport system substrate-binding protein